MSHSKSATLMIIFTHPQKTGRMASLTGILTKDESFGLDYKAIFTYSWVFYNN